MSTVTTPRRVSALPENAAGVTPSARKLGRRIIAGTLAVVIGLPLAIYALFPVRVSFFLHGCPTGYVKLAGGWHYVTWNVFTGAKLNFDPIDCDDATFRPMETENGPFAVDRLGGFSRNERIPGSDPVTFEPLAQKHLYGYSRDAQHVYCRTEVVAQADPATFRQGHDQFNRDAERLYCHDQLIVGADPDTWKLLADTGYAVDRQHVFLHYKIIPLSDSQTFEVIADATRGASGYSRDARHVFYEHAIVKDADPAAFHLLDTDRPPAFWYAADRAHVFQTGRIVPASDPATFRPQPWKN